MDSNKSTFGIIVFIIILLVFIVGGYFLMDYMTTEREPKKEEKKTEEIADIRIDKSKDYIYYEVGETVIEYESINFQHIVINLKGMEEINTTLKTELDAMRNTIVYTKDVDLTPPTEEENESDEEETEGEEETSQEELHINEEGIYSLDYREYVDMTYNNYISVLVKDYSFDIQQGSIPKSLKAYTIDKENAHIYTKEELLNKYSVTDDTVKEKIKDKIADIELLSGDTIDVDTDKTLANYDTMAFYINKSGKLEVTFIVKSNQIDYNESVVII